MVKSCSPLEKLFAIKDLKDVIQLEIQEFWAGAITDASKLVLTRDELTSILLFILVKAEIPDLYTQLKLITEFTSPDIQDASHAYAISDTYMLLFTTVSWLSSLPIDTLQAQGMQYLQQAKVQMREEGEDFTRYDRIRFSEVGDRFDPFSMAHQNPKNSYIGGESYLGFGQWGAAKKSTAGVSVRSGYR
jgi:Vacuolar sorting protein 9 (VPS9) domain